MTTNISLHQKYGLTINEASEYFGIGEKKLRQIISEHIDSGFVLQNGSKHIIKRQMFEDFLNQTNSI